MLGGGTPSFAATALRTPSAPTTARHATSSPPCSRSLAPEPRVHLSMGPVKEHRRWFGRCPGMILQTTTLEQVLMYWAEPE